MKTEKAEPSVAFTPGPWELDAENVSDRGHFKPSEIFSFADEANPKIIATLACRSNADANGRLISAAPDMYKALQYVLESADMDSDLEGQVRAALQKAGK